MSQADVGIAFDQADADLFADPDIGCDATYHPPGSAEGVPIRVILDDRTEDVGLGLSTARVGTRTAEVRRAELPAPEVDGRLVVAGTAYRIKHVPARDTAAVWSLELVEVRLRA